MEKIISEKRERERERNLSYEIEIRHDGKDFIILGSIVVRRRMEFFCMYRYFSLYFEKNNNTG